MAVELTGSSTPSARAHQVDRARPRSRRHGRASRAARRCPARWRPKWKSSPTTTSCGAEGVDEHPLDELTRGSRATAPRRSARRRWRRRRCRPSSSSFCGRSVSSRGADSGRTTRRRVAVEGEHDRPGAELGRRAAHLGDHGLVAEVDAVVGADGDDGALARPRRRRRVGDDVHGRRRYPRPSRDPTGARRARPTAGFASAGWNARRRRAARRRGRRTAHGPSPARRGEHPPVGARARPSHRRRRPGRDRARAADGREQLAGRRAAPASAMVNGPTAVRRRLRRWAPPPSSRPRSAASVRT